MFVCVRMSVAVIKMINIKNQTNSLLHRFALHTIYNLEGNISMAPVEAESSLSAVGVCGDHGGHQAYMWPIQTVIHGQLGGDAIYSLIYCNLHTTCITGAFIT